ncbi:MAG: nicotinamide mononucleotide transporter family protein [Bacteroidota bacterium]
MPAYLEILSVAFSFLYLFFAIKQNALAWIFGIIASLLAIRLFYDNNNWGSIILNGVYVLQGIFGFLQWRFFEKNRSSNYYTPINYHLIFIFFTLLSGTCIIVLFPSYLPTISNKIDVYLAIGSVLATFLEIRKDISCWYYWITLNLGFTFLYLYQGLNLYAILMLVLGIFSVWALKEWTRHVPVSGKTSEQ